MDNLDYIEFDHAAGRHFGEGYGGRMFARPSLPSCKWCGVRIDWFARGKKWVAYHRGVPHRCEKRIEADLKAAIASMPDVDAETPKPFGPITTKWVKRGHIMRFHPEEFFKARLAPVSPGAELVDADVIAYYFDDGSGQPLREFYRRKAPAAEVGTVYTSDIDEP